MRNFPRTCFRPVYIHLIPSQKMQVSANERVAFSRLLYRSGISGWHTALGGMAGTSAWPTVVEGICRSGEIAAIQPKAAGSSLMMMLTRDLCLRMIKISGTLVLEPTPIFIFFIFLGILAAKSCIVLPMATGMGIVMALIALRKQRQRSK